MNRKGHVGTLLLVLGALVLVTAGLFSFYSFGDGVKLKDVEFKALSLDSERVDSSIRLGVIRIVSYSILSSKKSADFELTLKTTLKSLAQNERIDSKYGENNVFAKISNLDYKFVYDNGKYSIYLDDLFYTVKSDDGLNLITKRFDLRIIFDNNQVLSVENLPN